PRAPTAVGHATAPPPAPAARRRGLPRARRGLRAARDLDVTVRCVRQAARLATDSPVPPPARADAATVEIERSFSRSPRRPDATRRAPCLPRATAPRTTATGIRSRDDRYGSAPESAEGAGARAEEASVARFRSSPPTRRGGVDARQARRRGGTY